MNSNAPKNTVYLPKTVKEIANGLRLYLAQSQATLFCSKKCFEIIPFFTSCAKIGGGGGCSQNGCIVLACMFEKRKICISVDVHPFEIEWVETGAPVNCCRGVLDYLCFP